MGTIHSVVGSAVESAQRQARDVSLRFGEAIAIVTRDRSGVFLAWASTPQSLAKNELLAGRWRDGRKLPLDRHTDVCV